MNRTDVETMMYGETVEQMRSAVVFTDLTDPASLMMYSMSILSDAQAVTEFNGEAGIEQNRQYINKAKYFMGQAMEILKQQDQSTRCSNCNQKLMVESFRGTITYYRNCQCG